MSTLRLVHNAPTAAGRLPPHDLDAERAVLSACILDPSDPEEGPPCALSRTLEILRPEHFYSEAHGRIWEGLRELRASGVPVDVVSLASWLRSRGWLQKVGGSEYLAEILEAPSVAAVDSLANTVLECWEKRQMIATCQRIEAELYYDVGDWDRYRSDIRGTLGALTAPRSMLKGATADRLTRTIREQIEASAKADMGIRWPWPSVARLLGVLARGRHHVLGGRSEHGKSSLALAVAVLVASMEEDAYGFRQAVYIHSLDMSPSSLIFRTACSIAGLDAQTVELDRNGTMGLLSGDDWDRLGKAFAWLDGLPIIVDGDPVPPDEVGRRARAWKAALESGKARRQTDHKPYPKCQLQLVVGDHAQKVADVCPGISLTLDRRTRITAVSNGWLAIAKTGFATLMLSQMRRVNERRKGTWPIKEELEGSGALEQDADDVIAIHAPERMGDRSARWRGVRVLVRCKGRFGADRRAVLLDHDRGWFSERDIEPYCDEEESE